MICLMGIRSAAAGDLLLEFEPVESDGDEVYALEYQTAILDNGKFDPRKMTEDSQVIVKFRCEDPPEGKSPVVLIWQTWGSHRTAVNRNWTRISAAEYGDNYAVFNYADIVSKYGTDDFSEVYTVLVADTGSPVTLKSVRVTALDIPEEEGAPPDDPEEETVTENSAETEPAETEEAESEALLPVTVPSETGQETEPPDISSVSHTENTPEQHTDKDKKNPVMTIIAVVLIIAAGTAAGFLIFINKKHHRRGNRFY